MNWKKLQKRIPKSFKIGQKIFKVEWIESFKDKKQVGETDWNNKLIQLKTKESSKNTVHTYFHECLHTFSDEFQIKLTEKQVQGLEKTLIYWIKNGNILK